MTIPVTYYARVLIDLHQFEKVALALTWRTTRSCNLADFAAIPIGPAEVHIIHARTGHAFLSQ